MSPMATILHFPTKLSGSVSTDSSQLIAQIPIVKQGRFFLTQAAREEGIRLTENGNLNRAFVQKFWCDALDKDEEPFKPDREDDCWEATRMRFLLEEFGYVTRSKRKIAITDKGSAILETGSGREFYRDLLEAGAFRWNWEFSDGYENFDIQDSFASLCNALWRERDHKINALQIFNACFETAEGPVGDDDSDGILEWDFDAVVSDCIRCLQLRFIIRFCLPFGLLKRIKKAEILTELNEPFEKTEFLIHEFHDIACPLIHEH